MPIPLHVPIESLTPALLDIHRAIESFNEEFEAVAWYSQRAAVATDPALKAVLEHNRDEELEHASMLLEWLRRNFPQLDEPMRTYLFTTLPITEVEQAQTQGSAPAAGAAASLNIGSMK
ncbi:MAG: ferritin-like domain-containing protein [Planctomycetaceae bacterium]|nr:ferritin-like domain-containing protein [Planctomycetaceae bacterium]